MKPPDLTISVIKVREPASNFKNLPSNEKKKKKKKKKKAKRKKREKNASHENYFGGVLRFGS